MVTWDADALEDLESLTGRGERKAVIVAIRKLRNVGNALGPPHVKSLKSEPGLMELRPRQGRLRSCPGRRAGKVLEAWRLMCDNDGVIMESLGDEEEFE